MRVIYLGKNKPVVMQGLKFLIARGASVVVVVGPQKMQPGLGEERLVDAANRFGIPTATDEELYAYLSGKAPSPGYSLKNIDLVISFLFWKKIRKPLIRLPGIGCINLHPAPLPDFRGLGGYNFAIFEKQPSWGVSAHFVDEHFDTGDIIKVERFAIHPERETAWSLEQKSQRVLLNLFKETIEMAFKDRELPRTPQGKGRYIGKAEFEKLRKVSPKDTLEEVERKIRAFWYPPFQGASMELHGKEFTLVSPEVLKEIGEIYHVT